MSRILRAKGRQDTDKKFMERKIVMICMFIGTAIGGYIPTFFGADIFSISSILGTVIGGFLGIWIANRLVN
ncbi:MAG: hypothetical protein KBF99_06485 [Leptospiraceae bacterium]|nr:hypothetical protein [Leptospiraceae bacterium]MBK9502816.1 hypothetical protein [Leptospiraceae bacterium]MBL0262725.1 hypothetical protein [Leptospiraceae bacterium]MBP9162809.1 hypothetical protein [Leptospiraceae bacterium]